MQIHVYAIPQVLRESKQWVCWKYIHRKGESKPTKVPINAKTGGNASSTNPKSWSSIQTALKRFQSGGADGIGFVFNDDCIGIDLDNAIDEAGLIKPWAAEIVREIETYTEKSPSGTGLHLISGGALPTDWKGTKRAYHDGAVEIYSRARFFTVTGDSLNGYRGDLHDHSKVVIELYKRIGGPVPGNGNGRRKPQMAAPVSFDVSKRLEVALRDPVFNRLWSGDTSGNHGDDSAADLALCNKLAFYFGRDFDLVDRLFRQSGLYREKWERSDYRAWTITKAVEGTTEVFSPKRKAAKNGPAVDRNGPRNGPINNPGEEDVDDRAEECHEVRPTQYSDDALADLFSTEYEDALRYVDEWGWLQWTGTRWQRISEVLVMGYARRTCRYQSELCKNDPDLGPKVQMSLARAVASAKTVAAVVKLASSDKRHYAEVEQFDADLWSFNTPGGTVDLRTGTLRPHRREDYITKIGNATPKGDCPKWQAFLNRITDGNAELQGYQKRLAGYSLVGDPSEECLDFFYGLGGNGKGTLLKTLQFIFGEYSTTAAAETFLESKGERHPTDVAKLAGARLVVAQEVDKGRLWNESLLKTMTGRDEMTARFMRRDFFNFNPQFTLIISGNNKPSLKNIDQAWRRRFHLVPFTVTIPNDEQNPDLKTELQAEADGIMKWCVDGCLEWQRQRLNPPDVVLAATADYFESEDTFEMWLSECCLRGDQGFEEPTSMLFASYKHWKEGRSEKAPGTKGFSQDLEKKGFLKDRNMNRRVFKGLRLTDEERTTVKTILEAQKRREGAEESTL